MTIIFFLALSAGFLIYGALIFTGTFTPLGAKVMIEEEDRRKWCRTDGLTKILWGVDLAILAMYLQGSFLPYVWLGCLVLLTVYIIYLTYKNNQKYMK